MLVERGARVETAASAASALEMIEHDTPDILLCDIGMPGMDDFELMRRLRAHAHPRVAGLKAIALTAFARAEDESRALGAGFDAYLRKPVEPAALVSQVARLREN